MRHLIFNCFRGLYNDNVYPCEYDPFIPPDVDLYLQCGSEKECFGTEPGCVATFDCSSLIAYQVRAFLTILCILA